MLKYVTIIVILVVIGIINYNNMIFPVSTDNIITTTCHQPRVVVVYHIDHEVTKRRTMTVRWAFRTIGAIVIDGGVYKAQTALPNVINIHVGPIGNTKRIPGFVHVAFGGETFSGSKTCGKGVDILFDGTKVRHVVGDCHVINYNFGLSYYVEDNGEIKRGYNVSKLCEPRQYNENALVEKPNILLGASSIIKRGLHNNDALFRIAVFEKLNKIIGSEYVHGTRFINNFKRPSDIKFKKVECAGRDYNMATCKNKYGMTLDMENTQDLGYISEKLITGFLSGSIPVYYGSLDVTRFFNPKSFIHCTVDDRRRQELFPKSKFPRSAYNTMQLLDKVGDILKPDIDTCVDKVLAVWKSVDIRREMLNEPIVNPGYCERQLPNLNDDMEEQLLEYLS